MLQDLAALTPPIIVCVAFLIGVGMLLRRELAPRRRARRDAAGSSPERTGSAHAAAARSLASPGALGEPAAPGEGPERREAETAPDRGDASQT